MADCSCHKHSTALQPPCLLTQTLFFVPPLILNFYYFIFYSTLEDVVHSFYSYLYISMFLVVGTRELVEGLAFLASSLFSARQLLNCQLNATSAYNFSI